MRAIRLDPFRNLFLTSLIRGTGPGRLASRLILVGLFWFSFLIPALGQVAEERTIVEVLRIMFPEAVIEVEPLTNALIVKAPPALQERIEEMIGRLDVYHPQITIETKFVEVAVADVGELGIETDILDIIQDEARRMDLDLDTTWAGVEIGFPATAAAWELWYTRLSPTAFQSVLRALEEQGKINVLSAPTVTTLNRQSAILEITETIPYITDVEVEEGQVSWTIEEIESGIFLEVTPRVPEGSTLITLDLRPRVVDLVEQHDVFLGIGVPAGLGWPTLEERIITTTMVIDSGETVVLGGLIREDSLKVERRVPLLGDIPLLGHAFRHRYSRSEKRNLLIFVTAYLLSPEGEKIIARR